MIRYLAAAAVLVAGPAFAQAAAAPDHSMHAGHASHGDHAAHGAAHAKLTLDSPIEAIVANPKGRAVLDAALPGLTTHEHYPHFKAMTLNQVAPMSNGMVSAETLAKVKAELEAIEG